MVLKHHFSCLEFVWLIEPTIINSGFTVLKHTPLLGAGWHSVPGFARSHHRAPGRGTFIGGVSDLRIWFQEGNSRSVTPNKATERSGGDAT